ncbi:MAG: hypothetical protein ACI841_002788 [Planctomycetota bacterium]|jgi:hypothetical protein
MQACSGSGANAVDRTPDAIAAEKPDGTRFMVAGLHDAGTTANLKIIEMKMGRLVEVFGQAKDLNTGILSPVPMYADYVIAQTLTSIPFKYQLSFNPVTSKESLLILSDVTTDEGLALFDELLADTQASMEPIFDPGLNSAAVQSMVPRNAAILITFNDLIDPDSVNSETVRVAQGVPPVIPYQARIIPDMSTGGLVAEGSRTVFYPSRIIVDPTISTLESFSSDPPLTVNGVGFPPSVTTSVANLSIRIPTLEDAASGQQSILRNPTNHAVAYSGNGTIDSSSSTRDILRTMRSGGPNDVTSDDYNGFLPDDDGPEVVGSQPLQVTVPPQTNPGSGDRLAFIIPEVQFDSSRCSQIPVVGDVITQSGVIAEVTQQGSAPLDGAVRDLNVRLLLYPTIWDSFHPLDDNGQVQGFLEWEITGVGTGEFLSIYDSTADAGDESCFLRVLPTPPFPEQPGTGLIPDSTVSVRFSEPMDPTSITAFDSMTFTRKETPETANDYVVGSVLQSLDLQNFTFEPDVPLAHAASVADSYFLTLTGGENGPTDLAGNGLQSVIPSAEMRISPFAAVEINGGRVTRFTTPNEESLNPNGNDNKPEWNGQHLFDLNRELIRPRSVIRYTGSADRDQALPGIMTPIASGVITPLSGLGSKMQTVYRSVDFGYTISDTTNFNLDIEGMAWSPIGGQVIADHFDEFEIRLSHGKSLPDEAIDPASLFPKYPQSGLKKTFGNNILSGAVDPQRTVHPKNLGYTVSPGDLFSVSSGTLMMPYPLNRTVAAEDRELYTWRDTRILKRAAAGGRGAEVEQWEFATGTSQLLYTTNNVPTVGLPLLMEFRTYPDVAALGLNSFDISIAINTSSRPYFRAFSTGGRDQGNQDQTVDPDIEESANGGFNPGSNPPGATTYGLDPVFYIGALDFVIRVSTSHSVWFKVTASGNDMVFPEFSPATTEPKQIDQPLGTSVVLAFRGAQNVGNPSTNALFDASEIDPYGDHYHQPVTLFPHDTIWANNGITFTNGQENWFDNISGIDGSHYFQVRATFLSNPVTALIPELSALAVSWKEQE